MAKEMAAASSQRALRCEGGNNHSGSGGVHSRFVEWDQIVGEEGLGLKLLNKHHCNIVTNGKQGMCNKRSEGDSNNTAADPREKSVG